MFQSYFTVWPFSSQQEKQYDQTEIEVKSSYTLPPLQPIITYKKVDVNGLSSGVDQVSLWRIVSH